MKRSPRILVTSHSLLRDDPRVTRAVRAFRDEGWNVEGFFQDPPIREEGLRTWRFPVKRRRGGIARYSLEYGSYLMMMFGWVLWRTLVGRPSLVYVNSPPDIFVLGAVPAKLRGTPVILDVHDPMPELWDAKGGKRSLLRRALVAQERIGYAVADGLVTVHDPVREVLEDRNPGKRLGVVMNVPWNPDWERINQDRTSRTLVFTGTVAVRYGTDDMISAVALAVDRIPGLRLRIIGDGEDLELLQSLATNLGVADRIEFTGRIPHYEIRRALEGTWLGLNLPKPNTLGNLSFSNKVVEWVSIGLPVVASRTSTMLRYFPEGTLFYVPPADPEALADRLVEIDRLGDDGVAENVARAAESLEAISWPNQRRHLLESVRNVAPELA